MHLPAPKSPLEPGLYLVATPIGNLEDITLRALRVLEGADRIACEDTRQTQKLLHHYGIRTPTVSYHMHNEVSRSAELLVELHAGGRIALVSDAGTPGIADPGGQVVASAIAAGLPVFPVPGANAALAALVASGLPMDSFTFHGFLPAKQGARRTALEGLVRGGAIHIFYEAPHRILETLADVEVIFGARQEVVVARELTKLHEEFLRAPVHDVRNDLASRASVRGEIVLLLAPEPLRPRTSDDPEDIGAAITAMMQAEGLDEMAALKRVARERGVGKSVAYREWQRGRKGN